MILHHSSPRLGDGSNSKGAGQPQSMGEEEQEEAIQTAGEEKSQSYPQRLSPQEQAAKPVRIKYALIRGQQVKSVQRKTDV